MSLGEAAALALGWLLPALAVTASTEVVVAGLLGFRTPREFAVVALANLATNPAVNLLAVGTMALMHAPSLGHPGVMAVLAALEVTAVLVEWRVYHHVLSLHPARAFAVSVGANTASLVVGLLVFGTGSPGV